jgi:SAM-dependent methyltransferase
MTADLLAEQVAYYRARAAEYDDGAYPDARGSRARIAATVADLRPAGTVLELACGTGMWTAELARYASVTAVDSSPETIAIARRRCPDTVRFQVGDIFRWQPDGRFDIVFFAFWLSHVPPERFADFFDQVARWLTPAGRAIFVDEPTEEADKEPMESAGTAIRTLSGGARYRIVKWFLDPLQTGCDLARLGWRSEITARGDWLVGQARRR